MVPGPFAAGGNLASFALVSMVRSENSSEQTSFVVDDFALNVQ
jgi:hypothetical protein